VETLPQDNLNPPTNATNIGIMIVYNRKGGKYWQYHSPDTSRNDLLRVNNDGHPNERHPKKSYMFGVHCLPNKVIELNMEWPKF
jgi:hypothetical protein